MSKFRSLVVIAASVVCAATQACARPPEVAEEAAAVQDSGALEAPEEAVAVHASGALEAPEEIDDPMMLERIAFMNSFAQRVKDGDAVADMMSPTFFFVYNEENECGGYTGGFETAVPASDVDRNFIFPATFAWEDPDCDLPWDTTMQLGFHLSRTIESWGGADIEAVDADFTLFSWWNQGRNDYLLVHIKPSGDTYEVSQIEYRLEYN